MESEGHWTWADVNVTGVVGGITLTFGALALGWAIKKLYNYYTIKKRQEHYLRNDIYSSYMTL